MAAHFATVTRRCRKFCLKNNSFPRERIRAHKSRWRAFNFFSPNYFDNKYFTNVAVVVRAPRERQQILHFLDPIEVSPIFVELTISMTRLSRPTRERFFNSNQRVQRFLWTLHHFLPAILHFSSLFSLSFHQPRYIYRVIEQDRSNRITIRGFIYTRFARFVHPTMFHFCIYRSRIK